jgi:hypothetical protein
LGRGVIKNRRAYASPLAPGTISTHALTTDTYTPLAGPDVIRAGGFAIGNLSGRNYDELNLSAGWSARLAIIC